MMDELAKLRVKHYIINDLQPNEVEELEDFNVKIVAKCEMYGFYEYICKTTLYDDLFYEVAYSELDEEWGVSEYKCICKSTYKNNEL